MFSKFDNSLGQKDEPFWGKFHFYEMDDEYLHVPMFSGH